MSYKRHQPVDIKEMEKTRWDGHHSICQQLRDIWNLTDNMNYCSPEDIEIANEIKLKARIAMSMAKSMHNKLKAYGKAQNG